MKNKHPSREECFLMLKEYQTPEHVIRHCVAVTDVALSIAEALMGKGYIFDLDLIQSAGLIHDIARVKEKHWLIGAEIALQHGYAQEAEIIREHMKHPFDTDPEKLTELDMVCLGDRLILEDEYVGLDRRMQYVINKAKGDKAIEQLIRTRKEFTRALIRNIENIIGKSIDDLIKNERKELNENT